MRHTTSLILAVSLLAAASYAPARADDYWHGHHDIHDFHDHDFDHWRGGHWVNAFHDGRNGWWWVVDGLWYFYPAPIYPYPDPYTPPTVVVEQGPAVAGAPSYVYYCSNPAGYYPYVPQCYGPWQKVANAAPQVVVQQPQAQTVIVQPTPAPAAAPQAGQREIDERKLNDFTAEFKSVDTKDRHARATLKNLEAQVEAFRQSLYERDYNAMSVLKSAEELQHRIAAQRERLGKAPPESAPVMVVPAPPPQ